MPKVSKIPDRWMLAIALLIFSAVPACQRPAVTTGPAITTGTETVSPNPRTNGSESEHLAFGNLSNATTDPADQDNFLILGNGSAFSYNDSRGTINWVSWRTERSDLGDSIPRPDFRPDPRLPDNFKRIGYYDYSGSGFDRGHMVPSADRFASKELNEETFLMTNIVPQSGALNQYPWNKLESFARGQAWRGSDLYQAAGVYGDQGSLKGKIVVPTNCWKVIVVVPRGKRIEANDPRMRVFAVDMPNDPGIENVRWERYLTTIRTIESKTGLDFFSTFPAELQDRIENRRDTRSGKP
ncbi:MAG TPA: DNA/RNA non-specific endonuclease [Pyrinomonadaceae bacterium]|nr:DNA/RNA non-specific endonuclease [Chloracidobacterium sp.]HRJ90226.1 DNA/RNA non-specific endonuclease [Pyrinomonadaceae bacterium]HRK51197.1 DNA/RNA non-specific endonuclease [Pyrinomonadaceae bacterium]